MNTRMYNGDANCGPVAIQITTGKDYSEIINNWPGDWSGTDNDKGLLFLPNDAPYDHFTLLEKLNINYNKISKDEVLNGMAEPEKTVLLLHIVNKPSNILQRFLNFFRGIFRQHWVVLVGYTSAQNMYMVDWGYWKVEGKEKVPDIRVFNREEMDLMLSTGWPYCAYTVDTDDSDKVPWYQKLYAKIV